MLQPWMSYCIIGDRAILLDAKRNRYTALNARTAIPLLSGQTDKVPAAVLRNAERLGWLGIGTESSDPVAFVAPVRGLGRQNLSRRPPLALSAEVVAALIVTRIALAALSLHYVLTRTARRNERATDKPGRYSVQTIVEGFDWAERYLLTRNTCLLRSIAQQRVLARNGHASSVVIGAKLNPFEAHCWLQQGDVVINDTLERVGLFVPVRVTP